MPRLRLLTFNIAHGRGLNPIQGLTSPRKIRVNLRRIAALLDRLSPHVVAMQEIDERSRWSGNFDHLDYLRVHARFPHAFFGINNRRTGLLNLSYGNAVLSRFPLLDTENVVFGRRHVGEKGFLFAEIDAGGRRVPFVNLHFHSTSRARRLQQLDKLIEWLRVKRTIDGADWTIPPIICGDFNNPSSRFDATGVLLEHLSGYGDYALFPQVGATYPSPLPQRAIDFVFLPSACRQPSCQIVRTLLSDHCPVLVEFAL